MELDHTVTALVTGANGGIGTAIARALKLHETKLVLSGRRPETLQELAAETKARVIVADLAVRADVHRLCEEAGPVDVLVLNAALPASGPLLEFTEEQIVRAMAVNLEVPIVMARYFAERMVERGRGQIVFISSISGKVAARGTAIYSATKFGMRGFALGLRDDLHGTGVGVSTIFPGFIRDAGMFHDTGVQLPPGAGTRTPGDVAQAVLRAIRDDAAEIDVAAFEQVAGAYLAAFAPGLVSRLARLSDGERLAKEMSEAQKHKR
ncbi:MAG: SDR family NAD(P)-dependent oxidoreductase [Myxococcales bacterium]|nr:SDR family NAD(P)-dependent oxidoreductase [Myxococcales bacterium]MBL8715001.1 SDR family NAD(P)-dependent oxidoreductase [Myxococcales bacterium]